MIHADSLTKYYGPHTAIHSVSFSIGQGEIVGFLGPNGAGKTTTMRILTAYTPPSEGTATIGGYDVFLNSLEVRQRIGYLPETVPLYLDLTVWEYLDYVAALRQMRKRDKCIADVIEKVDLGDKTHTLIAKLSKGMRQRVGIAQAIVHNPQVLILDEPTVGLDPKQIIEVRQLIKSLGGDHTIILSTHILSEVEQICSRVLIINRGQIVAEDTPEGLSGRLAGGERIRLKVEYPAPQAVEVLSNLAGVRSVTPVDTDTFDIECQPNIDCRPNIANFVVEQGWGLLELNAVQASLEDIFLELTATQEVLT